MTTTTMTIGTLAKKAGTHVETIRYYQHRGLLVVPQKPYGGIRRYDGETLHRLRFIKTAQWLGFSLEEIGGLLTLQDGTHCDEARALGEQKLTSVRQKILSLKRIEHALDELVQACSVQQGNVHCPLISSLHDGLENLSPQETADLF